MYKRERERDDGRVRGATVWDRGYWGEGQIVERRVRGKWGRKERVIKEEGESVM